MLRKKRRILTFLLSAALVAPFYIESTQATDCIPTSAISGSTTRVTFTNSNICDWEIPSGVTLINLLVVAGGGGGGFDAGGGGGGGGVDSRTAFAVTPGNIAQITVGTGGLGATTANNSVASFGGNGTASTFTYSTTTITRAGGSGGGNCFYNGTTCRNNGGASAGPGGGNGGRGPWLESRANAPTNGSSGSTWSVNSQTYGGGGGGGAGGSFSTSGTGGSGGGGDGGVWPANGGNGVANTGGGGGGAGANGGNGANGVVIVSYTTPTQTISITSQPSSSNPDLGDTVTISVAATSLNQGTLSYRWYRQANTFDSSTAMVDSGTAITGTTSSQLRLNSVTSSSAGIYRVKITNTLDTATTWAWSNNAIVYVSLASETFQNSTLSNPDDWVMTYSNPFGAIGATEHAFGPCLTARNSNQETVTATNPPTVGTVDTDSMRGCHHNYAGSVETVTATSGQGSLRLTQSINNQSTFVLYDVARNTVDGLDIRFNSAQWGSSNGASDTADGFTFFLKDGTDTSTNPGTSGGALGYSTNRITSGIQGGLLGIGFDVYGNYSNSGFGGNTCTSGSTYTSSITRNNVTTTYTEDFFSSSTGRQTANSIIIRGPQGTSTTNGYCIISPNPSSPATAPLGKSATAFASTASEFSARDTATRRIRVIIEQISAAITSPKIYVYVDGTLEVTADLPEAYRDSTTFKFGFTGSTGGLNNKIDIWSTQVNTYSGITAPDAPDAVTTSAGSAAGSRVISWTHDNAWGLGEATSGTREFTATVYDSNDNETNYSCSTTATSGSPATSCTITGIPAGDYTVKVTATNFSNLRSPPSTVSNTFTSNGDSVITSCAGAGALENGSFESETTTTSASIDNTGPYPTGWRTTALATRASNTKAAIETWQTQGTDASRVSIGTPANSWAQDGTWIAEIAADNGGDSNAAGGVRQGLYQDVNTISGVRVFWSYWHHFRSGLGTAVQVSRFQAGPTPSNIPAGNVWTASEQAAPFDTATVITSVFDTVTSTTAWQQSSGTFLANSSSTRFLFSNSVSPANGYGNLIDNVRFTTYAACPITVSVISGRDSNFVIRNNEQDSTNFRYYGPQSARVANVSGVPDDVSLSVSNVANTSSTFAISSTVPGTYVSNYQITYPFGSETFTSTSSITINVLREATAKWPKVIPVDPRISTKFLTSITIGDATNAYACFDQVADANGTALATATFTLSNSPLVSDVTSTLSGGVLTESGTVTALRNQFSKVLLSAVSTRLVRGGSKYLRARVSSRDNTDGVAPLCTNGVSSVIELKPIPLSWRVVNKTPLRNGNR